jgi:5'-nucleotidase
MRGAAKHWPRIMVAASATAAAFAAAARPNDVSAEPRPAPIAAHPEVTRPPRVPVRVRLLGINDLHGHLDPTPVEGRDAGGVAWLSAWLDRLSADGTATIRVSAGDAAGASPLISGWFDDRPAIEALDLMHFDVGAAGNHDFDQGRASMQRRYGEASFPMLGANTLDAATGRPFLPPYAVVERAGVKVGFIGVTTRSSGRWLLPRYARELRFTDISDAVNRYAAELEQRGVRAIVVVAHAGGSGNGGGEGEIVDETREMPDAVDAVIAGHTHTLMDVKVGGRVVTQAVSFGTAIDDVELAIDPQTDEVIAAEGSVVRTFDDAVTPDRRVAAMVDGYRHRVAAIGDRHVTDLGAAVTRVPGPDGRSALGTLIAESERVATGADMAFIPRDWIRADLPAGRVTFANVYDVQPFGNAIVRMDMSGSDVQALARSGLESSGVPARIDPSATYSVAASEFLASGGEGFAEFRRGANRRVFGRDADALASYLERRAAG